MWVLRCGTQLDALVGLFDVVGANIRCVDSDVNFLCDIEA